MRRILVAEDSPVLLEAYGQKFRRLIPDCVVALAANGQEALDIYKSGQEFDVICTDNQMPLLTGVELVAKLRQLGCKLPIYVVSDTPNLQAPGATAVFPKSALHDLLALIAFGSP